jgi:RES domain-containing protein
MVFHLRAGQPVVPSRLGFGLHELRVRLQNVLDLSALQALEALGLDMRQYGRMSYLERTAEYPRTQEIAEVAHFHGYDGLLVPSARSNASNVIVFCDRIDSDQVEAIRDHGIVDWNSLP